MRLTLQRQALPLSEPKPKPDKPPWLRIGAAATGGFLFAGLRAFGSFSPFAAAFLGAVPFSLLVPCFCGGVLGLFSALSWQAALTRTCALLLTGLFRLTLERRFRALYRKKRRGP